jgi:hypothetical protein
MQKAKVMATVIGGALLTVAGGSVLAQSVFHRDNEMMALSGEWEIGNGETHMIAAHKKDETYRICVRKDRYSVPLKVMFDGKEETIASGNCADIEAMDIKIAPAGKLQQDFVLIGKFDRLNK